MIKRKTSVCISLAICILSALLLAYWIVRFPAFFRWFYLTYHRLAPSVPAKRIIGDVTLAFYCCAPFAAAALGMLIALLRNILKDRVYLMVLLRGCAGHGVLGLLLHAASDHHVRHRGGGNAAARCEERDARRRGAA